MKNVAKRKPKEINLLEKTIKKPRLSFSLILLLSIISFFSFGHSQVQTILWPELNGTALWDSVIANFKPIKTLGYDKSRDTMYAVIDLKNGGSLSCVYTGYTIKLDRTKDPSADAYNKLIDCEHTWPQSMGADSEPQKSNLHHLYPTFTNVNSSRGNDPFAEIPDAKTDKWWYLNKSQTIIPTSNIDKYSEKENDPPACFEPREDHKGNCARSMFYFYAMYSEAYFTKDPDMTFWNFQKETLLAWNYYDTVDADEYARTWKIATYQDNKPNPFVLDSTLARRIWFYKPNTLVREKPSLADDFKLHPCYPNPFNKATNLAFTLPEVENVTLSVFDLNGHLVNEQQLGRFPSGHHIVAWNGGNLSSGVYIYCLQAGQRAHAGKLLIIK
ncbi:MAG TPA: endonuclease [Candidatus Marinimicrobia bacterium]|nr:endonuclease [Candidatus Neomarinimicrobiota bacterium]